MSKKMSHRQYMDAIAEASGCCKSVASWLAFELPKRGYGSLDDIVDLKLSEAASWWQVGPAKLEVLRKLGAIDDLEGVPTSQRERLEFALELCSDLYLCNVMSGEGKCYEECPYASGDGCTAPNFKERMRKLGLIKTGEQDG